MALAGGVHKSDAQNKGNNNTHTPVSLDIVVSQSETKSRAGERGVLIDRYVVSKCEATANFYRATGQRMGDVVADGIIPCRPLLFLLFRTCSVLMLRSATRSRVCIPHIKRYGLNHTH